MLLELKTREEFLAVTEALAEFVENGLDCEGDEEEQPLLKEAEELLERLNERLVGLAS